MQLVKTDYLVVSLPRRKPNVAPTLGYLSTKVCRQQHSGGGAHPPVCMLHLQSMVR